MNARLVGGVSVHVLFDESLGQRRMRFPEATGTERLVPLPTRRVYLEVLQNEKTRLGECSR